MYVYVLSVHLVRVLTCIAMIQNKDKVQGQIWCLQLAPFKSWSLDNFHTWYPPKKTVAWISWILPSRSLTTQFFGGDSTRFQKAKKKEFAWAIPSQSLLFGGPPSLQRLVQQESLYYQPKLMHIMNSGNSPKITIDLLLVWSLPKFKWVPFNDPCINPL